MTWKDEIEREYQRVAPQLGTLMQAYDSTTPATRLEKAVAVEVRTCPPTRAGVEQLLKSKVIQDLSVDHPAAARHVCLAFVLGNELVRRGEMTPQEVGILSHELDALTSRPFRKAVPPADAEPAPRPWAFDTTERGLQGLLHSDEMEALKSINPARWRAIHLDFFASIKPTPGPREISMKRQELEIQCPDHPAGSTVTKSMVPASHLSHGQSVCVANFGSAIGDPEQWMIRR